MLKRNIKHLKAYDAQVVVACLAAAQGSATWHIRGATLALEVVAKHLVRAKAVLTGAVRLPIQFDFINRQNKYKHIKICHYRCCGTQQTKNYIQTNNALKCLYVQS
jgi:hypothetical protein